MSNTVKSSDCERASTLSKAIPLLPLRSGSLFPGTQETFSVGRPRSSALIETLSVGDLIAVASQKSPRVADPALSDLHQVGTLVRVLKAVRVSDRSYRITLEGVARYEVLKIVQAEPFLSVEGTRLSETDSNPGESRLLAQALEAQIEEIRGTGGTLGNVPVLGEDPGAYADRVVAGLDFPTERAAELLALTDASVRLRRVIELLAEITTKAELKNKISHDVRAQFGQHQREAILREQLKAIRKELGDDEAAEADELADKLQAAELPEEVSKLAQRELKRLEQVGRSAEAHVIRTYLEWVADLPWEKRAAVSDDLAAMSDRLDADHFGLEDVKRRVLEQMAVHKLSGNQRGTILALVGPPGVGKTSLGQSIADATGRPLIRIALGGVRDEAEIRGHRRTYVGALPGRILHALRKAKVKNPLILLDEVDKLSSGFGGSPEAALLEVLDPEQNRHFTDHYLETPFDLSEVMFVATANSLESLSAPLRDRLEVVELSGYTEREKQSIARRHLIGKRTQENGLPEELLYFSDAALGALIRGYTREAGVRQLDREVTRITRRMALRHAKDPETQMVTIEAEDLQELLGKPKHFNDVAERTALAGVATGLAWTPVGGDILFVETTKMPGKGRLEITGQLGDVMKESARAALSYLRSNASDLGVDSPQLDSSDLHLHVPAGAVPKDGPSAGVTIFTALSSLLTGRCVRADTAMTGECTLRGKVLPVGGIKAKLLAAHRAGITRVILPEKNERDLDELPEDVRAALEVVLVSDMKQVLAAALEPTAGVADIVTAGAQTPAPAEGWVSEH